MDDDAALDDQETEQAIRGALHFAVCKMVQESSQERWSDGADAESEEGGNLDGIGAGYDITEGVLTAESGDPDYTIVDQIVENLPDDQQEFITDVQDVAKDLPES